MTSIWLLQTKSLELLVKEHSAKLLSVGICRGLLYMYEYNNDDYNN